MLAWQPWPRPLTSSPLPSMVKASVSVGLPQLTAALPQLRNLTETLCVASPAPIPMTFALFTVGLGALSQGALPKALLFRHPRAE